MFCIAQFLVMTKGMCKKGKKEMFYLTTHSTHFYLLLYGIGHMVKDHFNSKRENPLYGLIFYTGRIVYITASVTPVVEHWLE